MCSRVEHFQIDPTDGVTRTAELRSVQQEKNGEVEVLPVVDLSAQSAFGGDCGRCNTSVLSRRDKYIAWLPVNASASTGS